MTSSVVSSESRRLTGQNPNLMKNTLLLLLAVLLVFTSCSKSKDESPLIYETAIVSKTKFPCGPACTADAWLLVTDRAATYEAVNLPETYKVSDLAVSVAIRKTGSRSNAWEGTGEEKVEIVKIMQR